MEKRSYNVYKFSELNQEQKNKVIEKYRDFNVEGSNWWEPIYEGCQEQLKKIGFENVKINFSGFWSQGDGASFTASINVDEYIKALPKSNKFKALNNELISAFIKRNSHHYQHSNTIGAEVITNEIENDPKIEELANEFEKYLTNDAREQSDKIYKALEKYYSELISDEALTEYFTDNNGDYMFTVDGKID